MKKKASLLVISLLASFAMTVGISEAKASDCTAESPCGTWAMLDSQGVVTNVIVCQAAVCGGGTWAGQTVVPQVAPNPVTHDTTGQGSYIGNSDLGTQVVYSDGTFTISENTRINNSFTEIQNETITTSKVSIPVSSRSFTYEDTIGKSWGQVEMTPVVFDESSLTTLSVKETNLINTIQETISFNERKTINEIQENFTNNNLNLLLSKVQILVTLLGSWIK
jgi:hypothetical protein